jgi:atypical dual specificity phosphatase
MNSFHDNGKTPKVLVHCQMGRSRSASLVIMYILYKMMVDHPNDLRSISTDFVTKFLKHRRSVVDPNKGFVNQIYDFEAKVRTGEV